MAGGVEYKRFLHTFRYFTTPSEVMTRLVEAYDIPVQSQANAVVDRYLLFCL